MRRETWLAAIFTALFVLQAPLCAVACLQSTDYAGDVATSAGSDAGHACHDESSVPDPDESSSAHRDCGCDTTAEALVSQPSDLPSASSSILLLVPFDFGTRDGRTLRGPSIVGATDLPPPDILLLHSILIV